MTTPHVVETGQMNADVESRGHTAMARGDIATAQKVRLVLHEEGISHPAVRDFEADQATALSPKVIEQIQFRGRLAMQYPEAA